MAAVVLIALLGSLDVFTRLSVLFGVPLTFLFGNSLSALLVNIGLIATVVGARSFGAWFGGIRVIVWVFMALFLLASGAPILL